MTYDEFISRVISQKNLNPDWRWGQTYFNTLWLVNVNLATYVYQTDADPYYRDDRIHNFLTVVYTYFDAFGSVTDARQNIQ